MIKPTISTASPLPSGEPGQSANSTAPKIFAIVAALLLATVIAAGWQRIESSAFLFHLKAGEVINSTGQIPNRDIFSAGSAVEIWSYIEWGWSTVLALAFKWGEWPAINTLGIAVTLLTALLMLARCRKHGSRWFESFSITTLALSALLPLSHPAPSMASLPLFILALMFAEGRRLWPMILLVPVTTLWANIHPAFLLPLLAPAARLIFPPPSHNTREFTGPHVYLTVIIIGGIFGALISPHSVDIIPALIHRLTTDAAISAVHPAAIFFETSVILRAAVAIALLTIIIASRRPFLRWEMLTAFVLAAFTLISTDSLNFLLVYLAPPAAGAFTLTTGRLWASTSQRTLAATAFVMSNVTIITLILLVCRITPASFGAGLKADIFPEAAAGRLSALPLRASVLNAPADGGYLSWRLWPGWKITIDNRPTLYSRQFREEYEKLWAGGAGWQKLFNLWRTNAVMGNNDIASRYPNQNLFYELANSPDWTAVYWDSQAILYLKSNIDLGASNLSAFRQLKPGISWAAMEARITSAIQWQELAADLRRVLLEDPHNNVAREFLRRTNEKLPSK